MCHYFATRCSFVFVVCFYSKWNELLQVGRSVSATWRETAVDLTSLSDAMDFVTEQFWRPSSNTD